MPASGGGDQSWYWTEEWQRAEREADSDIRAGRIATFDNVDEFLRHLDERCVTTGCAPAAVMEQERQGTGSYEEQTCLPRGR